MCVQIIGVDGFFEPIHSDLAEHRQYPVCGGQIPPLVGVTHQRDITADGLAYGPDALCIFAPVRLSHLDLDPPPAAVDERIEITYHLRDAEVEPAAVGVVGLDRVRHAAEQPPQWYVRPLCGEVPQSNVHHGQCHMDDAAATDPVCGQPVQALPGAEDVLGRGADERRGVVAVDDVAEQLGATVDAGDAGADRAVGGADLNDGYSPRLQRCGRVGQCLGEGDGQRIGLDGGDDGAVVTRRQVDLRRRQQAQHVRRHLRSHSTPLVWRAAGV